MQTDYDAYEPTVDMHMWAKIFKSPSGKTNPLEDKYMFDVKDLAPKIMCTQGTCLAYFLSMWNDLVMIN